MKKAFATLLDSSFSFLKQNPILLAVSGGIDSMVLTHLCHEAGLDFAIAHCNFKLRGLESDADAVFVSDLATQLGRECFIQEFDTKAYASDHKVSIQMAARELRYAWFEEVCEKNAFKYLVTAHHAQDDLETFLINLGRGTGLDGLTGIPVKNKQIVRPLLNVSREQIRAYADDQGIFWREDSSNETDNYLRNHLRHHAIPALVEANNRFLNGFQKSVEHLQESRDLLEDYTALLYSKIVTETFNGYELSIVELQKIPHTKAVLYQLLKGFGFTAWDDIYDLIEAQSGKYVSRSDFRLIKDREKLILTRQKIENQTDFYLDENSQDLTLPDLLLKQQNLDQFEACEANEAIFDAGLLQYPLHIRKWKEGDTFAPFGMNGKKKKLSKLFKDLKYSAVDKEAAWVVCSDSEIIWVVGVRSDERFKLSPSTTQFVKLSAHYD